MTASQLANSEIWWQGPKFLREVESKWPKNLVQESPSARREIRTRGRFSKAEAQDVQESTLIAVVTERPLNWRLNPLRFLSWIRLVRVHAWVSRFVDNCCLPKEQRTAGEITLEEIKAAEIEIITRAQQEAFANDYIY